ncbi:hypothetical protein JCM17844_26780 [Iodidimonas gelatinilytica]|uniref:DUF952 domain-containing protein n=1 Tax=Iodidimonas gelatinilytica TaxID=1236966 RepID=A0A5A7MSX0_9PROT|nr:DUF952 domain-containing protein [Iodidimonas gelatinilytica]GEQ99041.1 hypothetical protein JCM17844_26780 [Iodidimonas gelatinilytica]
MRAPIYKIMSTAQWQAFKESGHFKGSEIDLADGYIHFSTREQVAETLDRHYKAVPDLVLLSVDVASLDGDALRWEAARGGQKFPHLYAPLPLHAVSAHSVLDLDEKGRHSLPTLPEHLA